MRTAQAVPVLMYHHVSPNPGLVTVSPAIFRAHMAWLAANGYHTITCDELAGFLQGKSLPNKSVLITFDDGYLDNYVYAYPILKELGLRATFFVVTGWIGEGPPRNHFGTKNSELPFCPDHKTCMARIRAGQSDDVMLRWSEVETMLQDGTLDFHSHTHTHTRWDREVLDPSARYAALGADLAASRKTLSSRLGRTSTHLCWPQGFFDEEYQSVALETGFTHLYTVEKGPTLPSTPATSIKRIDVKNKGVRWLSSRLWLYRHPLLANLYIALRTK